MKPNKKQLLYGTRTKNRHRFINDQIFLHTSELILQTGWILIHQQNRGHLPLLCLQEEVDNLLSLFNIVHVSKGLTSAVFSEPLSLGLMRMCLHNTQLQVFPPPVTFLHVFRWLFFLSGLFITVSSLFSRPCLYLTS